MRPLLCIFQPRDIPEFLESVKQLPYDKLWLKYIPMEEARNEARIYFLEHSEYSHLVILTDDLIVHPIVMKILEFYACYLDIVSGWCNGNTTFGQDDTDLSTFPPDPEPFKATYESYRFMTISDAMKLLQSNINLIIVRHQGFNPSFISRRIVEQIPFRTSYGCCSDSCFSLDLYEKNIPQFVELTCRSKHLKKDNTEWYPLQVGKKEMEIVCQRVNHH